MTRIVNETELEIRYADTDQMGVVHNSVYACYCEIGRTKLCEQLGKPYHELEQEGIYLMVAEMQGRFKAPIRYGDRAVVRTWISALNRRFMAFAYEIYNIETGQSLYTGSTKHVFTKRTQGAVRVGDEHYAIFARGLQKEANDRSTPH